MKAIPSYIKKITTLKDKSLQLTVETQEVDSETKTYLFDLHDSYGFMLYFKNAPNPEEVEIPEGNAPTFGEKEKSPAQRMRNVLFVWWKQQGEQGDFEVFYRQQMEKMIDHFKGKLT